MTEIMRMFAVAVDAMSDWPMVVTIGVISSVWLALGLACVELLSRRPARAHAAIMLCVVSAIVTPFGFEVAGAMGWGWFEPLKAAQSVRPSAGSADIGAVHLAESLGWGLVLWCLWVAVSGAAALRIVWSYRAARRLARRASVIDRGPIARAAHQAASRMALSMPIDVALCNEVGSPVLWGWSARARVIVPESFEERSEEETIAVMGHELAHLARRDHWWQLALDVSACSLAWNPLVWMCRRRARAMSEQACDTWALTSGVDRATYAEALILLARVRSTRGAALGARGDGRGLARRVHQVLYTSDGDPQAGRVWLLSLLTLALAGIALGTTAHRRPAIMEQIEDSGRAILPTSLLYEVQHAGDGPAVRFAPGELDLGRAPIGGSGVATAWLVNVGDVAVDMESIRVSCSCTSVLGFEPGVIDPGQWIELTVTMTAPESALGHKTKMITLRASGQPDVVLPVTVRGAAADGLKNDSTSVDWTSDAQVVEEKCPDCGEPLAV